MKPRTNGAPRAQKSKNIQGEGPSWVLIAGGALLSTLSVRLGYKLKQALDSKRLENASNELKGLEMETLPTGGGQEVALCIQMHILLHKMKMAVAIVVQVSLTLGISEGMVEVKRPATGPMLTETHMALPLVTVPAPESNRENGVMWAYSPDRLELPRKPFHHSNSSESPCVSESGSDIFSKREVIHKLRQQLKKRDDMIMEMQDQIMELQNSLNAQLTHSTLLQSQLDAANRDLFDSEREIQRLRKAIADHCMGDLIPHEKPGMARNWPAEGTNGHVNGYLDGESNLELLDRGRGDGERIEMLKREVGELKEVIEGKEYLLQSYKEQKTGLSSEIKELQYRLASQLPNIL
ncbi:hypothetical protein HHK36_028291 [Tetracentron sinense]|uniref:Uncharacterized protein n=1 Tax=Tetracentron sinense TaxID=13715 RepID=A0A835D1X8_TETSI|nr:hypothetical protein HHK36_028291 [Tetracentron sinense]